MLKIAILPRQLRGRQPRLAALALFAAALASATASCARADAEDGKRPGAQSTGARAERPNIIVVLTDDQGYADVGFNGSKDIPTPNIDRIAREGVRFERGYVTFPVCGPSRAGLLTGRYQSRFGFDLNPSENPMDPAAGLPVSEDTIATVLKRAGYTSAIIGKWHMGMHANFHPLERGFDEFYGFRNGGHQYFTEELRDIPMDKVVNEGQLYRTLLEHNRDKVRPQGYVTDILSDQAVRFVKQHKSAPFFLYLSYNAPHAPLQAPARYTDRFPHISDPDRRIYAGMIAAVDDGVGKLLDKLDELGIAKNTIVFFLSDNGGPQQLARNGSSNAPLRGGKGDVFEGGVRVPFAMRWPGKVPAGANYPHMVSALDILGTAVGVNRIEGTLRNPIDGKNLVPFLQDTRFAARPHDQLFWRYRRSEAPIYNKRGAVAGDDKLVEINGTRMLFDLSKDVGERQSVHKANRREVETLEAAYRRWNAQMIDLSIPSFADWPVPAKTRKPEGGR